MNHRSSGPVAMLVLSLCLLVARPAAAQKPLDLFPDAPRLSSNFVRIGAWNLRHINVEGGADEVLPGETPEEDAAILAATFAKAIEDLGLDLVAVIEHQPRPGEPNRLHQLRVRLNRPEHPPGMPGSGPIAVWKCIETNIEYDEPFDAESNPFGGLQMGLLWNAARGVQIADDSGRLLTGLRQPRDEQGELTEKRTRAPWLVPVRLVGDAKTGAPVEFDLIVLHLKSGGAAPQGAEVNALTNFMREHQSAKPHRHLVVCGDWNVRPDQDFQGAGRVRLRQMMVPGPSGPLMHVLTVEKIRPTLDEWAELDEKVGGIRKFPALGALLPYSHFNNERITIDTLLDHIAISRSLSPLFAHPVQARLANGGSDLVPGIQIARPLVPEARYSRLTDHLPVVLTLRVANAPHPEPPPASVRIVAARPHPDGDEKLNEEIHLKNFGGERIDLRGWLLKDSTGAAWQLGDGDVAELPDGKLAAAAVVVIRRNGRAMSLTNSGDSITLVDPQQNVLDIKTYNDARTSKVIRFE